VGYLSFLNQLMIPLMAAGKNLLFWPLGPVMRHGAAFFIRRSIKGLPLYTEVFAAYVRTLVQEKVNINFYIEGGRSRTGKLMPPRTGMLGFVLEAIEGGAVEDLAFIPTYSGYDQIPEEKSYLSELAGREKEKESIVTFFQAKEVLKRRFGGVYVRFDDHITLGDYCRKAGMDFKEFFGPDKRKNVVDFANYLMYGIVRVSVAGPIDITSASAIQFASAPPRAQRFRGRDGPSGRRERNFPGARRADESSPHK
jgi:glycerol-3-phosphate O-acyltransferase